MVVYPHGVQPLFIGTEKSIRALEQDQEEGADKRILLVAKLDPANNDPLSTVSYIWIYIINDFREKLIKLLKLNWMENELLKRVKFTLDSTRIDCFSDDIFT